MARQEISLCCWNVNWAKPGSPRAAPIASAIKRLRPDILCMCEGYTGFDETGHWIASGADYGYGDTRGRRKIMLWSREPWRDVNAIGHSSLPPGRFIVGTTDTNCGPVHVMGLAIPWAMAHVATGQKNRNPWQDHMRYLDHVPDILANRPPAVPLIVTGDFNQRVPRGRQPKAVFEKLSEVFLGAVDLWTAGEITGADRQPVCHIGGSSELRLLAAGAFSRRQRSGKILNDHDAVTARIARA